MIRAVLYDVGGVLHTSEPDRELELRFARQVLKLLEEQGVRLEITPEKLPEAIRPGAKDYKRYGEQNKAELPGPRIWSEFYLRDFHIPPDKLEPCAERLCALFDGERTRLTMRPGLPETVEALHRMGIRQGIVSNIISTTFVPAVLQKYGIADYMECVVMSSQTGIRKPDPAIFHTALEQLGISPGECAYVGDTVSRDVIGSRKANLGLMIQIDYPPTHHKDEAFRDSGYHPDYKIFALSEILPILTKENNKLEVQYAQSHDL